MKKCYIIQPGKIGDIIIVLPIAKYYADRGYEVYWFVYEGYLQMFEYIDYVKPIPLFCGSLINDRDIMHDYVAGARAAYYKLKREINLSQNDIIIDLSIGFSESKVNSEWRDSGLSFDKWKYKKSNVPFSEKYKLKINEKSKKEKILGFHIGVMPDSFYSVKHSVGSTESFQFDAIIKKHNKVNPDNRLTFIDVREVKGFTIFDWVNIIRYAQWLYCVDSCVANLANQLGLCKNRRVFKSWDNKLVEPKIQSDWIVI